MFLSEELKPAVLQYAMQGKLIKDDSDRDSAIKLSESIKNELIQAGRLSESVSIPTYNDGLPEFWTGIKIKDIVLRDVSYGIVKLGEPAEDGIKVLRCSDVKAGYIVPEEIRTVKQEVSEQYSRTILHGGEIVINVRGTLGGCAIVPDDYAGYNIAREVAMIDIPKCINKEYVMYCLLSPLFWEYMQVNLRGIAYKGLNINLLKDFVLPLPPTNMQNKIVEKIEKVLLKINDYAVYEKQLQTTECIFFQDLRKSLLQDALLGRLTEQRSSDSSADDIIENIKIKRKKSIKIVKDESEPVYPSNWRLIKLTDAADIYTGDSIPEEIKEAKYAKCKEGYNYIATENVNFDHSINYENGIKIPYEEDSFKHANPGATLLCIEGGSAGRKIAILDEEVCFGNKLCAFNPIGINSKFLFYYLQSPIFLSAFTDKISGIIGGVNINKIRKLTIPIPPIEEQQRIVDRLDALIPLCNQE